MRRFSAHFALYRVFVIMHIKNVFTVREILLKMKNYPLTKNAKSGIINKITAAFKPVRRYREGS